MGLFQKKRVRLHSRKLSTFKIECDSLSYLDVECLCYLISTKFKFRAVFGVPDGGVKFAECLKQYCSNNRDDVVLIVDDVLTTGQSMCEFRDEVKNFLLEETSEDNTNIIGVVIFARGVCPKWVTPIFSMDYFNQAEPSL